MHSDVTSELGIEAERRSRLSADETFSEVAAAAARVVGVRAATVVRFERDGRITVVGSFNAPGFGLGSALRPERSPRSFKRS
jgi:hypothetical protein